MNVSFAHWWPISGCIVVSVIGLSLIWHDHKASDPDPTKFWRDPGITE